MNTRIGRIALLLATLAFVGSTAATAQSIDITAVGNWLGGSDYSDAGTGIGGQAAVLFPVSQFMLGGGAAYVSQSNDGISENTNILNLFGEIRYPFQSGGSFKPFVGARGGYVRSSLSIGNNDFKSSGYDILGEVGGMFAVGDKVNVIVAGYFGRVSQGDVDVNGTSVNGTDTSGTAFGVRAGVNVKLGN